MDALHVAPARTPRRCSRARRGHWALQRKLIGFPRERSGAARRGHLGGARPARHFVYSKVMAWVALDRAVRGVERQRPARPGREVAGAAGPDPRRQVWNRATTPAQHVHPVLRLHAAGCGPADTCRWSASCRRHRPARPGHGRRDRAGAAVRRLRAAVHDHRTATSTGCLPGEGAFLACTFWLADYKALAVGCARAGTLFERLLALRNDVGLLAEEWDPAAGRMTGNFPQAFSHVPLVNTARYLSQVSAGVRDGAHAARHPHRRNAVPRPQEV